MKTSNISIISLVSIALTACGGDDTSPTEKLATTESYNENLSVANGELDTSTPAGIWLGNFRFTQEINTAASTVSITETGRSLFIITPVKNNLTFEIWLCSSTYNSDDNTAFSLQHNTLTHQSEGNSATPEVTATYALDQTFTLENNLNAAFVGTKEQHSENNQDMINFRMSARKISNAVTLTEAASEYDIRFTAASSNTIDFSDISDEIKCVSASREQIDETTENSSSSKIRTNVSFQSVNEDITFSEHSIQSDAPGNDFFQFLTPDENRSGGCSGEHCETVTDISVVILEENDEKLAFSATATGRSDLPDISTSFSISE